MPSIVTLPNSGRRFVRVSFEEACDSVDKAYLEAESDPRQRFGLEKARADLYRRATLVEMASPHATEKSPDPDTPRSGGFEIEL